MKTEIVNNAVKFYPDGICQCGAKGVYDLTSDILCAKCWHEKSKEFMASFPCKITASVTFENAQDLKFLTKPFPPHGGK